ncbi:Gfo/Idh/MocA family protein [Paenibacillus agricola]|uniref:Gfo/Idh/MocA family oxidoreductase n=1 Tax=Paenibacillus agricola TaxID=2716264 RepID=A0ABX0J5M3_9BACL|nr:Gfo/Idh/MocA family oxidoreductase [Paenibacillus agricola]NHN29349.1 Gfo/Idh/MocA family oxidoreductase [Paenibacillus agricola]
MTALGTAIIGLGSISGVHLKALAGLELAQLKAVVDINEALAKKVAEEYGCDYYTDYKEMLKREDIQVVHLCTAHYLHSPMTIDALKAGKHVLTEKPMAENLESAHKMLQTAAELPEVQLGVIFQNRYNAPSRRMKQAVDSGEYGKLVCLKGLVTWNRTSAYYETEWKGKWATEGGGVLINQSIHTVDLLQWLGGEIAFVKGSISTDSLEGIIEVEDSAHAYISFKSGATAVFYATNAYGRNSPVEVELVFEQATLLQRGDTLYLEQDGKLTILEEPVANTMGEKSYWGMSHELQIRDFYEHLLAGKPFWIDGPEGYNGFRLVMDIYESSRTGQKVVYSGTEVVV